MGRIVTQVTISNFDGSKVIRCDAVVDTVASHLVLPNAWRDRLGTLELVGNVTLETANQGLIEGESFGPVRIQVEGFRAVFLEVLFIEMSPEDGQYEPLLGYLVLEAIPVAVDMLGHRLVPVKSLDCR